MSIGYFHDFTEADFEGWLKAGMEAYLLEAAGAWAFPGAAGEIAAPGNLFLYQGLCESYRQLTAEQRKRYRLGLANVLASLEPAHRNVPIFEHLLSLAVALPAPEILRVLPARVGNGFFGLVKDEEHGDLFALTLLTVARFAAPRPDVLMCLNELIRNSRHFDRAYSGVALEALCRAEPEGFVRHMAAMRERLRAMFQEFQISDDVKRGYAVSVLEAVGLQRVVHAWPVLKYFDNQSENAALDNWFVLALLQGVDAPLLCEQDPDDRLRVCRRSKPEADEKVPEDGATFTFLLDLLRDHKLVKRRSIWFTASPTTPRDIQDGVDVALDPSMDEMELASSFGLSRADLLSCQATSSL